MDFATLMLLIPKNIHSMLNNVLLEYETQAHTT